MKKFLIIQGLANSPYLEASRHNIVRYKEEAKKLDIDLVVVLKYNLEFTMSTGNLEVTANGENLRNFDFVILHTNLSAVNFGSSLIAYLQLEKIPFLNSNSLIEYKAFDKLLQYIVMSKNAIDIVDTKLFTSVDKMLNELDSQNKILKPINGSRGDNIGPASELDFQFLLDKFPIDSILLQNKLPKATDYRVLVLNNTIVGVMQRKAQKDKLVSNYSAGGSTASADLPEDARDLAIRSAKLFNCDFAGVDIMFDQNNVPKVLEVNRNPQFEGFEKTTKINVAEQVLKLCLSKLSSSN